MKYAFNAIFVCALIVCSMSCDKPANYTKDHDPRRHIETAGGFSLIPPDKWTLKDFAASKYQVIYGPIESAFATNINIVDESYRGSLPEYADANLAAVEKAFKKFQLIEQGDFVTNGGIPGKRLTVQNEQNGTMLRQVFYLFGNGSKKYVVTATTLSKNGTKFSATFDECAKTFQFE